MWLAAGCGSVVVELRGAVQQARGKEETYRELGAPACFSQSLGGWKRAPVSGQM